jgi:hypothetical protein
MSVKQSIARVKLDAWAGGKMIGVKYILRIKGCEIVENLIVKY